jgi:c-di-GMP-binding flagellar brake protein YcgR
MLINDDAEVEAGFGQDEIVCGENSKVSHLASDEILPAPSREDKSSTRFIFDDMKLRAEDRLQLEAPAKLGRERFPVKVVGFLRGISLLVSTPITANGLRLQLLENEEVVMRSFCGQKAFAFTCIVKQSEKKNTEYLHLSFPDEIQGILVRKAPRIKSSIIATVYDVKASTKETAALISDISATGLSLDSNLALGNKGDALAIAFRIQLHQIEVLLSIHGVIRARLDIDNFNSSTPGLLRYGIEFQDISPNDSIVLKSMIYEQMIDNPKSLM